VARFQLSSLGIGVLQDSGGQVQGGVSFTLSGGNLYAASTGATELTALVTDSTGHAPGWLDPDNDPGLYTISYGSGATQTFWVGNPGVRAYGAVGDGVTDDTVAIQAAITAAEAAGGGTVFFPPGDYVVNGALVIGHSKTVRLVGSGYVQGSPLTRPTRLIRLAGTSTMITAAGTTFAIRCHLEIRDMSIVGNGTASKGVFIDRGLNCHIDRVRISGFGLGSLHLRQIFNSTMSDVTIESSGTSTTDPAFLIDGHTDGAQGGGSDTLLISNLRMLGNSGTDLRIAGITVTTPCATILVSNLNVEASFTGAFPVLSIGAAQNCKFTNTHITSTRTVTPVQIAHLTTTTRGLMFENTTVDFTTGSGAYAFDIDYQMTQWSNTKVVGSPTTALFHLGANVPAGRFQERNTYGSVRMVHDERAAGLPTVASAGTITLPAGSVSGEMVSVTGTTAVVTITAERAGFTFYLISPSGFLLTKRVGGTGNINIPANITMTAIDVVALSCDGAAWYGAAPASVN
jgi:Pectate lyase superfamily protein